MEYPVQEAFQRFYPKYRQLHHVTPWQEKAAQCIMGCKTGEFGYVSSFCPKCGHSQIHAASCGNRNCPCCQGTKKEEWVEARSSELIDGVAYFHVVFTIPSDLNPLMLGNQKELYTLLMRSASDAVLELSARPKNLSAVPGIVSVLHSWSSRLGYRPHVHMMVSGGGLKTGDPSRFVQLTDRNASFFLPAKQLSGMFRSYFLSGLKELYKNNSLSLSCESGKYRNSYNWQELLTSLYRKNWNVFLKETFNGNGNAIEYLARYSYRTAISNSRIVSVTDDKVTFSWTDYKDGSKKKTLTLDGIEFIRRFLLHVLPPHFTRIRFSGFLCSSRKRRLLEQIRRILRIKPRDTRLKDKNVRERIQILFGKDICKCPECGGQMTMHSHRRRKRQFLPYFHDNTSEASKILLSSCIDGRLEVFVYSDAD